MWHDLVLQGDDVAAPVVDNDEVAKAAVRHLETVLEEAIGKGAGRDEAKRLREQLLREGVGLVADGG